MKITPFLDRVESANDELNQRFIENNVFAIIKLAVSEIERNQNGQQYKSTEATKRAEDHIDVIAKKIMTGESSNFKELRAACAAWVEAAKPAPGINAELFRGEK
jgi:hypothetical protein